MIINCSERSHLVVCRICSEPVFLSRFWSFLSSFLDQFGENLIDFINIFKGTTYSFSILFLSVFFLFFLVHKACGILVLRPGVEYVSPAVESWCPNHWTTREFPIYSVSLFFVLIINSLHLVWVEFSPFFLASY